MARGHGVRVVCAAEPPGPARVDGIEVVRLPYFGKIGNTNLCPGLRRALRAERPDVIHTHLPTAGFADQAALASRLLGVPLVLTYNNDLTGRGLKGLLAAIYNRWLLPRLLDRARCVVVGHPGYPDHSPHLRRARSRLAVIPWGVDPAALRAAPLPPGPELVVGFLAVLDAHHRYKGLDVLLAAAARAPQVRVRVGGAGTDLERFRRLAARLGVAPRVEFTGFVPEPALADFYAACHLFALPSTDARQEGFGLVLLEAMACGRAVVASDLAGAAPAAAAAGAGWVVPPRSADALAAALLAAAADRGRLAEMGRRARRLVEERYTWDRCVDDYERLFASLSSSSSNSTSWVGSIQQAKRS